MTDQEKEFESIDDLFRRSFDNLPVSADPNGWDTPSANVWTQVQKRIKAPKSGWSAQHLWLLAAFAVTVAVALYWSFAAGAPQSPGPAEMPTAQPLLEAPLPARQDAAGVKMDAGNEGAKTLPPVKRRVPVNSMKSSPQTPNNVAETDPQTPVRPEASAPLPGSAVDYHNSTEREQAERAKKSPLKPLPAYRQKTDPPKAPEFLQKFRKE